MQVAQVFIYPNTAEIQIIDTSWFNTRYRKVYSRPITIYQGIDNPIQVIVKNQDQKPVNLTGYEVMAEIQDPLNQVGVASYDVSWANIALGRGSFTIESTVANALEQRFYTLTFKTISLTTLVEKPVYIDDNFGVPINLRVLPAYYNQDVNASTSFNFNGQDTILDGGDA